MSSPGVRYERGRSEFDRAIGFVDATFALALTLLITTLEVGEVPVAWTSLDSLGDALGTQFIAFLVAFAVIAGYWLAHHRMIASFAALDPPVIVANLGLIAAIVLLPFTTSAVGDPGVEDLPLPTALMAVNVALASLLHALVYALARRRRLLAPHTSPAVTSANLTASLVPAAVFLASVPIAYLAAPAIAQLSWLTLLPIGHLLGRRAAREAARA